MTVSVVRSRAVTAADRRPPVLWRAGAACARHPRRVVAAWIGAIGLALAGSHLAGGVYHDSVVLAGTPSATGRALLATSDPAASGYSGLVVMHVARGALSADQTAVDQAVSALAGLPHVLSASAPQLSADGRTAYTTVRFDRSPKTLGHGYVDRLDGATAPLRRDGVEVEYGGDLDQLVRPRAADGRSELIGFAVALVVLLVGFGSVAGAALPLLTALGSVLLGLFCLGTASGVLSFGSAAPTLALMIGLGVGIDYALFLTTRFRQQVVDGAGAIDAAGRTAATSGQAVLVAACTVSVALVGLYACGISFIGQLGFAAVFGVAAAAAGALTLVPAGLGLLGRRIDRLHVGRPVAETGRAGDGWHRYAALVGRRPWVFALAGIAVLAILAIPLASIRIGHVDDGADPRGYTDKRAYDLVAAGFGPGANGPLAVVVALGRASGASADELARHVQSTLAATPDVAHATPLHETPDHRLLVGTVVPASGPQAAATTALVHRLARTTLPQALRGSGAAGYVTGSVASYVQFSDTLTGRLLLIVGVVVATAFLLVMAAFRSLLLALEAALLNLLSIAAAYGVVVAVFQWGWGRSLLGVGENVPIESYVPVLMFAIVFGLSMDYEIFLLSRVREAWERTGDHAGSVAYGLSATGRVISCAALIMASVFVAFVGSTQVVIKMLAVGLAASVLIDATVVRLVLVPAVMNLLGPASWWMPRWLDRHLPRVDAEGAAATG